MAILNTELAKIEERLRHGDAATALQLCNSLPRQHRRQPVALKLTGIAAYMAGKPQLAINALKKFVAIAPGDLGGWGNLGNAYQADGRIDDAITAFRRAIEIDASVAGLHYNLGNALLDKGRSGDAEHSFRTAIQLRPIHAASHHNLALALRYQGRAGEARPHAAEAVRLAPDWPEAQLGLANCLADLGQEQAALELISPVLARWPNHMEIRLAKALALIRCHRIQEASALFSATITMAAANPAALDAVVATSKAAARLLASQGLIEAAVTACRQGIMLTPKYV